MGPGMKPRLSLKGRALQLLSQREHSRLELRRKLLRPARADRPPRSAAHGAEAEAEAEVEVETDAVQVQVQVQIQANPDLAAGPGSASASGSGSGLDAHADARTSGAAAIGETRHVPAVGLASEVDAVLDWLQAQRYLCDARFVESRVHARSARFGNLRIRQELSQHGVALTADMASALRDSEQARAAEVLQRKFGTAAANPGERAKQARFLSGRGFSSEVVWRVLRNGTESD